jgi:hypothetical protein
MTSRPKGGGVQGFCDKSTIALVIKSVTMGVGGSKRSKFASFMDDPLGSLLLFFTFLSIPYLLISRNGNAKCQSSVISISIDECGAINQEKGSKLIL